MAFTNFNLLKKIVINDENRYCLDNLDPTFTIPYEFYNFINNKIIIRITGKGNMGTLSEDKYNKYINIIKNLNNPENIVILFDGDTFTIESPFTVLIQKLYNIGYPVICVSMYKNTGFSENFYKWKDIFNKQINIKNYDSNLLIINKAPKSLTTILETININIGSYNPKYAWSEQKVEEALYIYFKQYPDARNLFQKKGNIEISKLFSSEYNEFYRLAIEQNYKTSNTTKKDIFRKNFKFPDKHYPISLERYKSGIENFQDLYSESFACENASGLIQPTGLQEIEDKNNIFKPDVFNENMQLVYSKQNNEKSLIQQGENFYIIIYSNFPYKKIAN